MDGSQARARIASLRDGLAKLGWADGRNVRIEYRWGAIDLNRARAYASELTSGSARLVARVALAGIRMRDQTAGSNAKLAPLRTTNPNPGASTCAPATAIRSAATMSRMRRRERRAISGSRS